MLPFVGVPGPVVTMNNELSQALLPASGVTANFPLSTMVYFQFVFAAITLVITAGAFLARMNFVAWMIYVPLWLTLSYTVGAFSLWGGGFLMKLGVIDYSGGYVIHLSSGTAGFVGAFWIGPRLEKDRHDFRPNNLLLVLVGAGILWTGWNGFNGGDPYAASTDAGAAVLNTNIATAMSTLTWTVMDIIFYKKPAVIGAVQGMITGLVAITPAAGVVTGWGSIVIGIFSGSIPWLTMNIMGRKMSLFQRVDDCLGVFHTHAVAGITGGLLVGFLATPEGSAAFELTNPGGAIYGNGKQVWMQLVGALFIIGWNIFWTSLILLFIKFVLRVPLRMSEADLLIGDDAIHGEEAYVFADEAIRSPSDDVELGNSRALNASDAEKSSEAQEVGHV
jgi:Amt family ammonium transporter